MNVPESDPLKEGFASARNIAGEGESCPTAERVWDSAAERLGSRENESVLRHVTACGVCAASWRVAREILLEEAAGEARGSAPELRPGAWARSRWIGLAAAATIILVTGIVVVQQQRKTIGPPKPAYRAEPAKGALAATIDPDTPLPRSDLVLRWTGAPDGTTYDLRVTSDRLEPLHRVFGIEDSEYRVPETALAAVPPGGIVLWTVTAHLAGGRAWTSPAFRATVE